MKKLNSIAIVGASGKMGQEIHHILNLKKISHFGITKSGKAENYEKVFQMKSASFQNASGIIDFSLPEAFGDVLQYAIKNELPLVCGTTGLSAQQMNEMKKAAQTIPILWSANMSIGIAVLKKAIQNFSALSGFDFQIEEFHHNQKKDSPSGTGIALQQVLQESVDQKLPEILSIRAGGIIGTHKIHAVSNEEHLIFEHQALSRRVFASGAVQAYLWLQKQKKGLYTIEDMIRGQ